FVYRRKKDEYRRVESHKVRLVAQGFARLEFKETFAPVAKFTSIRVLLALAARHNLKLQQADVDKAYLYGKLEEELYMRVPDGIDGGDYAEKALGYKQTISVACVYVRNEGGTYHYIPLYIDDLLFASPHQHKMEQVEEGSKEEYGIKDLGDAEFILGIQIHRRADGSIFLSQKAYMEDVLSVLVTPTVTLPNLPWFQISNLFLLPPVITLLLTDNNDTFKWSVPSFSINYGIHLCPYGQKALFLYPLLGEFEYPLPHPTTLFGDNQGANALSRDPQFHDRTRHLRLNEHFVREQVQQGFIDVTYTPTSQMVADVMTKSLPAPSFSIHRSSLGVRPF
ncbi:uncharacterized protein JCM6883_003928, partial [Sporobolomyces salmoneus]|uniref:uncharacterized protein n=1 Tax=Sporobolomyces salmoneus TaxID=183962 RepID=UPI00316E48F3